MSSTELAPNGITVETGCPTGRYVSEGWELQEKRVAIARGPEAQLEPKQEPIKRNQAVYRFIIYRLWLERKLDTHHHHRP
jgi:hypothetical protein